jgi:hypothetical protein
MDLLLFGDFDQRNLQDLVQKTERYIGRKIRTLVLRRKEYMELQAKLDSRPQFLLWDREINKVY